MKNINVKNGLLLNKKDDYSIYQVYPDALTKYYLSIPNNISPLYQIVINFPKNDLNATEESIIIEGITETNDKLYQTVANAIVIIPNIPPSEVKDAKEENDRRLYEKLIEKLKKFTVNAYWTVANSLDEEQTINQVIDILKTDDDDNKLMEYLEIYHTGLFKDIEIKDNYKLSDEEPGSSPSFGSRSDSTDSLNISKEKPLTKKLVPKNNKHSGFTNTLFTIVLAMTSLILSICMAYFLTK